MPRVSYISILAVTSSSRKSLSMPLYYCFSSNSFLLISGYWEGRLFQVYIVWCEFVYFRFINARRRIVQPIIDDSNRTGMIFFCVICGKEKERKRGWEGSQRRGENKRKEKKGRRVKKGKEQAPNHFLHSVLVL